MAGEKVMKHKAFCCGLAIALLLGAACSSDEGDDAGDEPAEDESTNESEPEEAAPSGEPLVVGVIASETGPIAAVSAGYLDAAEVWEQRTNDAGGVGGRPVEVRICDDTGTPDQAAQCARDLAPEVDVVALAGAAGQNRAAIEQMPDELVLNLSPNILPEAGTNVFTATPPVTLTLRTLFEFATEELDTNRIGLLASTDAGGEATVENAGAAAEGLDIELETVRLDPQDVDPSAQLTQLAEDGVGIVYVSYTGAGAATVVRAASTLGFEPPMVLNSASLSADFLDVIAPYRPDTIYHLAPSGAIVPSLVPEEFQSRIEEYGADFEDIAGYPPDGGVIAMAFMMDTATVALELVADGTVESAVADLPDETVASLTDIQVDTSDGLNVFSGFFPAVVASGTDGTFDAP
jgi:branched-chain amino acid transport system substrate-binding protein